MKQVGTIDATPTWQGILPMLLQGAKSGSFEAVKVAEEELLRMAKLADLYVESVAAANKIPEGQREDVEQIVGKGE